MKKPADALRTQTWAGYTMDALSLAALVTLICLVGLLVVRAWADPGMAQSLPAIQAGLIVSSILLLRQWTKARSAERAGRASTAYRQQLDPVTQLLNAEGFAEALGRPARDGAAADSEMALLCVSLDRLKDIYDRLGEACGDEVLRELSGRLVAAFGDDSVVGRIG
jgi:predicted signal transduction protein with EAL and GGDEF domain